MEPITAYADYRQYLRDFHAEQKRINPRYSHRLFARKASLASSGFFSEVVAGKRKLTQATVLRFSQAMKLGAAEQAYFECLVAFNHAKTVEEKNHRYARLMALRGTRVDIVGAERYEFYRHWWHAAIREQINCRSVKAESQQDFAAMGQSLQPAISAAQARRSVKLLLRLGFVERKPDGFLRQTNRFISTGSLEPSAPTTLDVDNFQLAMLDLARKALDSRPRSERDFSTLTLSLSAVGETAAKAEIAALRKRLLALAEQDRNADRVRQFNFQSFLLSKI
ncbi:MAG: TIGR02147 family protein [Fibrobacteres bacterium]|jgi:uncharacterized protein (TIGR02147 family)|nr:TIGR02147 family protein [Fibrobacterota bacterium]